MGIKTFKERVPVILLTASYRIEGDMHVVPGGRMLDEINKEAKKKMSFDWLEEDKDGFVKVCNGFKVPEIPEFKPYIP